MVGLEFLQGATRVDPAKLAPHLAELKSLEYIKLPGATTKEMVQWRQRLPDRYAVLNCPAEGD